MSTANKDYVSFQHVKKTYDGANLVVKDFNLDIAPGVCHHVGAFWIRQNNVSDDAGGF